MDFSENIEILNVVPKTTKSSNFFTKLYLKSKLKLRKKPEYTEKEKNIIGIVRKLCSNKNTKLRMSNMGYLLQNNFDSEHIVECAIIGKYVIITNGVYTSEKMYSDDVIKKINLLCSNHETNECDKIMDNMLSRENNMLTKIKNFL